MIRKYISENSKLVISIPHSGINLGKWEDYIIKDNDNHLTDVDMYVDKLIDIEDLNKNGISVICSDLSRVIIDLNRKREESFFHWRKTTESDIIYRSGYDAVDVDLDIYDEYYDTLKSISGSDVILIDLHSMPSITKDYHRIKNSEQPVNRPDICISGLENDFMENVRGLFTGFDVLINNPYLGGNISKSLRPYFKESIQIEINRKIYMDESTKELYDYKLAPDLFKKIC